MKLMKRIALIFISVTLVSSIAYVVLGNKIIEIASQGELERGPGRTNGAIGKINGEVNRITAQAREFGEYFSMAKIISDKHGSQSAVDILRLDKKIEKAPISNMIIVDNNFKIKEIIKQSNVDINSVELNKILDEAKELINRPENSRRGFFGGILTSDEIPYIVGVKTIDMSSPMPKSYTVVITPIDEDYMADMAELTGRDVSMVKSDEVEKDISEMEVVNLYNAEFLCLRKPNTIEFNTEFESLGNGPKYYIRLIDDRAVRNSALKSIGILVVAIICMTMIANLIIYMFIKKKVLVRIININKVVNEVSAGQDLSIELEDDRQGDEISVLSCDIGNMFNRLKDYSDNLEYIGNHDLTTDLANRNSITKYIKLLKYEEEDFSIFFIDLDNFKGVNDTLGHNNGDKLLCRVASKLYQYSEDKNMKVSRIGGDEFIIVRIGKNNIDEIKILAKEILNQVKSVYEIEEYSYEVKASMGISFYPQHSDDDVNLLQYADIAMYNSKNQGGDTYNIFDKEMLEPLEIESRLKSALEKEEFKVYYQPIFSADSEKIIGAEALIRWKTASGVIPPDKFISVAKKSGDIVSIDNFVLGQAIKTCREYLDKGVTDFYVSINASKRFLKQKDFINMLINKLDNANIPYKMLKLEITEDEIIDDFEYTIELLNEIRALGINVSLDDFGIGYSSFKHIKILPIDIIKLDRSLLVDIETNNKDKVIVETMIKLCHSLDLKVVCEGVEQRAQVDILKELSCDNIQGYYFSRPLPKDDFDKLMK
ncbi:MAG: EAL domain-containing protein [Clostridium sp.]